MECPKETDHTVEISVSVIVSGKEFEGCCHIDLASPVWAERMHRALDIMRENVVSRVASAATNPRTVEAH